MCQKFTEIEQAAPRMAWIPLGGIQSRFPQALGAAQEPPPEVQEGAGDLLTTLAEPLEHEN